MAPGSPPSTQERGWLAGLGRMARTTAFKLSAFYLLIFALFSGIILGYIAWNTRRLLDAQITETIETEINALAEQYRQGGLRRLVAVIERRGRQSGSFLYLLIDSRGDAMTGNAILRVPVQSVSPGWSEMRYNWPDEADDIARRAKVRTFILPSGLRLFVGRDLEEQDRLQITIRRARGISLLLVLLMGGFGAWFVTKRVLKRVEGVATTSAAIMAGNLSERLPVTNTNDEFDRLALHLNAMLDRIGELMTGLRDLSDNVAHDLRTPLTRLRNGAEDALRKAETLEDARAALERAIEESDNLLRIFDALQMIARAESGNLATSLKPQKLEEIVSSLAELYEPLAEEAGLTFETRIGTDLLANANRELIGQALSNLFDNALKYGVKPEGGGGSLIVTAEKSGGQIRIAVADRGEGIPEDKRAAVVERFVRLDASRAKPGLGLGLSLVAAVARLHGGELRLEDNAPGLRAVLVLPEAVGSAGRSLAQGLALPEKEA
ncbi:MAG: ATP-binding protein [Beijerinckiaceae bacterium]|jgi:signal transduction histidine kinase|nr:ATP-binding protein [Beijerinckiaceae bacterium]